MDLYDYYLNEKFDFSGWDFSYINNRMVMEPLPWSYESTVLPFILKAKALLDIDTGGGELLSRFPLPVNTKATEMYQPNIEVARTRLEPLGVDIICPKDENYIPLDDASLDLIINKHGYFNIDDLHRLLGMNGYFITQQVGNEDNLEINTMLGETKPEYYEKDWTFEKLLSGFRRVGFEIIEAMEFFPVTRIYDIGAFLFYMSVIPWQYPGFKKDHFSDRIREIHNIIENRGYWEIKSHRYLVIAQKMSH